jgi:hypothetical protein
VGIDESARRAARRDLIGRKISGNDGFVDITSSIPGAKNPATKHSSFNPNATVMRTMMRARGNRPVKALVTGIPDKEVKLWIALVNMPVIPAFADLFLVDIAPSLKGRTH